MLILFVVQAASVVFFFFFSSRRRHTRYIGDWSSDVCSSDLPLSAVLPVIRNSVPFVAACPGSEVERCSGSLDSRTRADAVPKLGHHAEPLLFRSEERRVGKECRSRCWTSD